MNKQNSVYMLVEILLFLVLIVSIVVSVTIGSVQISIDNVYNAIFPNVFKSASNSEMSPVVIQDIVWLIRLPRIMLAAAVGSGLAVCGVVIQAVVKNPLADPYVLGISSGASLGATSAILLGVGTFLGHNYVGIAAFIGAFSVSLVVMVIANVGGRSNPMKLILSGLALSSLCSAFSSFIIFISHDKTGTQAITFWLMGSLAGAKWETLLITCGVSLAGVLFFTTQYRTLNLMLLGDDVSRTLGVDLQNYRHIYLLIASLMIGFIVFTSGTIGFIGLIIPHCIRLLFGTNHIKIIPLSALTGAIFLIWVDVLARTIIPNAEMPIGILVSMVGAPCFVYLMVKKSYGFGGNSQ